MDISLYLKLEPLFSAGMSVFQMEKFVVGDNMTPYRKLRQALVETRARLETITTYGFDMEELQIKRKAAHAKSINENLDETERALAGVEVRRMDFEINRKQTIIDQLESEAKFFLGQVDLIVKDEFQGAEAAVQLLQEATAHDRMEKEFWTKKLARSAFADLVNYGTISKGLMESMMCLPEEQRLQIVQEATDQHVLHVKLLSEKRDLQLAHRD